jgi:hypothetical protein
VPSGPEYAETERHRLLFDSATRGFRPATAIHRRVRLEVEEACRVAVSRRQEFSFRPAQHMGRDEQNDDMQVQVRGPPPGLERALSSYDASVKNVIRRMLVVLCATALVGCANGARHDDAATISSSPPCEPVSVERASAVVRVFGAPGMPAYVLRERMEELGLHTKLDGANLKMVGVGLTTQRRVDPLGRVSHEVVEISATVHPRGLVEQAHVRAVWSTAPDYELSLRICYGEPLESLIDPWPNGQPPATFADLAQRDRFLGDSLFYEIQPRVCTIHGDELVPERVQILYGLVRDAPGFEGLSAIERNECPNAKRVVLGGCVVSEQDREWVMYCPRCRQRSLELVQQRLAVLTWLWRQPE